MNSKTRILIVGAGVAGKELVEELQKHLLKHYQIIGFIDDDKSRLGKKIHGITILGGIEKLSNIIRTYKINEVFIAIPSAEGKTIRRVIEECQKEKVVFRIVPRLLEIVQGRVKLYQVRDVQVEDLLGRSLVKSEQKPLLAEFKGKIIFVTGAAGSIGSELCRQLVQFKPKYIIALDWSENGIFDLDAELSSLSSRKKFQCIVGSIQDLVKIKQIMKGYKPDIVFHAAAFKHVPLMQLYPEEAVKNNVFGTEFLVKMADKVGVSKFVYISSDKSVDPSSVMGATKLLGEKIIARSNGKSKTKYIAVRFGNVLGSRGSVVEVFQKQIAAGGPVTITNPDMIRYFMSIPEAVQLVLQATMMGKGGEVFILDMGEPVKIVDLAKLMIQLAGFIPGEEIAIKYVGRRPGEKLAEELIAKKEFLQSTKSNKIYRVKIAPDGNKGLRKVLNNLKYALAKQNREGIFKILKIVAPNLQVDDNLIR